MFFGLRPLFSGNAHRPRGSARRGRRPARGGNRPRVEPLEGRCLPSADPPWTVAVDVAALSAAHEAAANGQPNGVAVGPDGSVYLVGTTITSTHYDALLRKYAADGTLAWSRHLTNPASAGNLNVIEVALAPAGDVFYATGWFEGSVDLSGDGVPDLGGASDNDLYVATFRTSDGSLVAARRWVAAGGDEYSSGIAVHGDDLFVIAQLRGAGDFDGVTLSGQNGLGLVLRLDVNLQIQARAQLPGILNDLAVRADGLGGTDLYLGGYKDVRISRFDSRHEPVLAKLDGDSLAVVWERQYPSGDMARVEGVGLTPDGVLLAAGSFTGQLTLGGQTLTSGDGEDQ